jgi:hypothetical protein
MVVAQARRTWFPLNTEMIDNLPMSPFGTKPPIRSKSASASEGRADMIWARYQVSS